MDDFFGRPPGWVLLSGTGLALALALWASSAPQGDVWIGLTAGLLLCGLTVTWVVRVVLHLAWRDGPVRWVRMLLAPALCAAVAGACSVVTPLEARWAMARPAFQERAERMLADADTTSEFSGQLSGYDVTAFEEPGEVYFRIEGEGSAGFAYRPQAPQVTTHNPDPGSGNYSYEPLGDGWFEYEYQ